MRPNGLRCGACLLQVTSGVRQTCLCQACSHSTSLLQGGAAVKQSAMSPAPYLQGGLSAAAAAGWYYAAHSTIQGCSTACD